MDPKNLFTNKSFCVLPWSGFILEADGDIKNCVISKEKWGNIHDNSIQELIEGEKNQNIRKEMINDRKPHNCSGCYLQEENRKEISAISSRNYYLKELGTSFIDEPNNFKLRHVDLRWTNSCNQACVYCGPKWSSKWAQELNTDIRSDKQKRQQVKDYIFKNIKTLTNIYLAGGEPMLMKENEEFLQELLKKNPNVNIRVNTNLSKTNTKVFDLICKFKNVHWTVSVETIEEQYEYVRYHGKWDDFLNNLNTIKKLNHKISFNMLFFILNYSTMFRTVDYFKQLGFHDNSFVIGPLYEPKPLNVLNLPKDKLEWVINKLQNEIVNSDFYLKNSYQNILHYITTTKWQKNLKSFYDFINGLDDRRRTNAKEVFKCLEIF